MKEIKTPGQQLIMLIGISLCCLLIGQAIGQIIVLSFYGDDWKTVEKPDPILMLAVVGLTHLFVHLVAFFIFLRVSMISFFDLFPRQRLNYLYLFCLPFLAILGIFLASSLAGLGNLFFEYFGFEQIVVDEAKRQQEMSVLLIHDSLPRLLLSVFVAGVLPAVGEEFIYRGIIQSRLVLATKNIHFSVVISALIFAAMHFQPVNLLALAALGIVLGYIYAFTRNIWYGVGLHFLINTIQVVQIYFWPEFSF